MITRKEKRINIVELSEVFKYADFESRRCLKVAAK